MVLNRFNLANWGCKYWLPLKTADGTSTPDMSGNSHNGTIYGSGGFRGTKDGANALYFDGSAVYVLCSASSDYAHETGNWTYSFWLNSGASQTDKPLIQVYQDSSNYQSIGFSNQRFYVYTYTGGVDRGYFYSDSFTWTPGKWYHIILERVETAMYLYINGVKFSMSQTTAFGTISSITGTLRIGGNSTMYPDKWFLGNLRDLMYFKGTTLSQPQIHALMDATYIE